MRQLRGVRTSRPLLPASNLYPPAMTLSLSTMWAQQERFVADVRAFAREAVALG